MFRLPIILLVSAMLAASAAADIDEFTVTSDLTYGYADDTDGGMQMELEIAPGIDMTLSPRTSLVASARIRLDERDLLEPGEPEYDSYAAASKPLTLGDLGSAELRDVYVEIRSERGLARLGKQQIVWGRLDGIKILDLVNPQDFREFIMEDFGESRIGLWSAYFDYTFGGWRAELAVVPDGTGHNIPDDGAWFELTASRFRFGAGASQPSVPVSTQRPEFSLDDTGVGLQLSRQLDSMAFSAVAYSGNDPEPLGRIVINGGSPTVERFYRRRDTLGASFDASIGNIVLRGEYAYQPARTFNTRSANGLATTRLDQHRGAIGMDIAGPFGVFVNIQYLVDSVAAAPATLVRPASDRIGTLFLRRTFGYEMLTLEARWYRSFTDHDQLMSAGISYELSDSTSVALNAEFFDGTADGLFGQFANRDRITIALRHTF